MSVAIAAVLIVVGLNIGLKQTDNTAARLFGALIFVVGFGLLVGGFWQLIR